MTLQIGITLALLCAIAANFANFLKHNGARTAVSVDVRHPLRSAGSLWRQPMFAAGMAVGLVAWLLHVAAISMAPLSVVQVVLAGGVVLIAVMADRIFGMPVGRLQWIGLALTAAALAMLAVTMPIQANPHGTFSPAVMIAFEASLVGIGGLLVLGPHAGAPAHHHGAMLATAAGILFGVCNVAVKALAGSVGDTGPSAVISVWTMVAVAASMAAFYASARSFQDGEAVETIAITGTAANVATIAGGIIVFGDPVREDALGIVVQAVAILMVLVASAMTPAKRQRLAPAPV